MMLEIEDLWVSVVTNGKKEILKGVNLKIGDKETHVLLGPNGVGKSCLIMTIMGIPTYKVMRGRILFDGKDITTLPINDRAELGIGLAFQNPPEIRGVKLGDIIRLCGGKVDSYLQKVSLDRDFGNRDVNLGFSGGERKRSELAQLFAMGPKLILLDEIDSGVDIESLELLGKETDSFISDYSCLIITHQGHILKYIKPDLAHILLNGKIIYSGDPDEVINKIREKGFRGVKND